MRTSSYSIRGHHGLQIFDSASSQFCQPAGSLRCSKSARDRTGDRLRLAYFDRGLSGAHARNGVGYANHPERRQTRSRRLSPRASLRRSIRPRSSNGTRTFNASPGDPILDTVELRNQGTARTLVLFDGQRVVTSNTSNGSMAAAARTRRWRRRWRRGPCLPAQIHHRACRHRSSAAPRRPGSPTPSRASSISLSTRSSKASKPIWSSAMGQNDRRSSKIELTAGNGLSRSSRPYRAGRQLHHEPGYRLRVGQRSWWSPGQLFPATTVASTVSPVCGVRREYPDVCVSFHQRQIMSTPIAA